MDGDGQISRNCREFMARLHEVAAGNGRDPGSITVVAVSKTRPLQDILDAVSVGLSHIGESKVQEVQAKLGQTARKFRLHMIGHLQTNKVKAAVELFDLIQSVDSLKLARAIDDEARKQTRKFPIMLEVNCGRETQKFGLEPEAVSEVVGAVLEMKNLQLDGLMTVAPFVDDEKVVRRSFIELRELHAKVKAQFPGMMHFSELSMGMTDDWELAVAEGSTMIRVGRALFGERHYS